jgi:hypothetical protein
MPKMADRTSYRFYGRLAQPVERLLYTQDVRGSSPLPPTYLSIYTCAHVGRPAETGRAPSSYPRLLEQLSAARPGRAEDKVPHG